MISDKEQELIYELSEQVERRLFLKKRSLLEKDTHKNVSIGRFVLWLYLHDDKPRLSISKIAQGCYRTDNAVAKGIAKARFFYLHDNNFNSDYKRCFDTK